MKKLGRVICFLLILVMLVPLTGVTAFAADEKNVKPFGVVDEKTEKGGYLSIGDSYGRGMGASDDYWESYNNYYKRNVVNSFSYNIAKAVKCTMPDDLSDLSGTYWPCCYPGATLASVMDLLGIEDDFTDTDYVYNHAIWTRYLDFMLPAFGGPQSVQGSGKTGFAGNIADYAERAGLITVELGMGDVFYRAIQLASAGQIFKDGEEVSFDSPAAVAEAAVTAVSEVYNGFEYWSKNYPKLIRELKTRNPDAVIVMIGALNPVADVELFDGGLIPVGSAFSAVTASMNALYRQWEKELGVLFVDISNVETGATQYDWGLFNKLLDDQSTGSHPTPEGYRHITRLILDKLPTAEAEEPAAVTTDIKLDLGRYEHADLVLLDGKVVKDFTVNGFTLTVPCRHVFAKNLTVTVNENGKVNVVTYQLSYHRDKGYTAYRIAGKNDVLGVIPGIAKNIKNSLGKLFK